MSSYWWVDRCLPGIVGGLTASTVWAVVLGVSHRKLWQRITTLTGEQTAHFDQATAEQTRVLKAGADESRDDPP